jgi:CTP synthase (UTP-ammonia lyase)
MTRPRTIHIALIGDHDPSVTAHQAIPLALQRAASECDQTIELTWVGTDAITDAATQLASAHAVWCVPGSPYRSAEGALAAIRSARETGRPFLGTCGGFQHALLEYAHDVLGLREASHTETDPDAVMPLISLLSCSLVEKSDDIVLEPGSRIARIFGATTISESYRCNYGLNRDYEALFADTPLHICGRDRAGDVRAMELTNHPFFFITLFQHERRALRDEHNPLVNAFVGASASRALNPGVP